MKRFLLFLCLTLFVFLLFFNDRIVFADELQDEINEQINNIDLTELENIFSDNDLSFIDKLEGVLSGNYDSDFSNYFKDVKKLFLGELQGNFPLLFSIIAICIILSLINIIQGNGKTDIKELVEYIGFIVLLVLIVSKIIIIFRDSFKLLNFLSKVNDIVSPILLTIMTATGGHASASVYSPTTVFLSTFINVFIIKIFIPAMIIYLVAIIIANFSNLFDVKAFEDFFSSLIKWSLGIISILFTVILSIQGITAGIADGISLKTSKYILQNSIPIIGGIVNGGFDFVLAGGIIIKNSIGLSVIILIFLRILKPLISIIVFSFLLKLLSFFSQVSTLKNISGFCKSISNVLTFLASTIIIVFLMFFVYVFLMIISANAFI